MNQKKAKNENAARRRPITKAAFATLILLLAALSAAAAADARKIDLTVAADGSGDVRTVAEAIARVPENNRRRFVIFVKPGVYREQVRVPANKPYVSLIGEQATTTRISFAIASRDAGTTSAAYAFYVGGHDFRAENITFENAHRYRAGEAGQQAVAVVAEADRAVFVNCRFLGWQDTLYAKNGRQFYENCYVEGHVDFIFGQAAAVFAGCTIHSKADGYVTAPMRFAADEPAGLVFIDSRLTGENTTAGVYLGRPWRPFGRTVLLDTEIGGHIRPEGWHNWGNAANEKTAYFAEYNSRGAGAKQESRAAWARRLTKEEADAFRAGNFLKGRDGWNPANASDEWLEKNKPDWQPLAWNDVLRQTNDWYATDEAARIGDQVELYQKANGGWEKNVDMARMLTAAEREKLAREKTDTSATTIDNRATYTQIAFLARLLTASLAKAAPPANTSQHRAAFDRGLDYLFAAQYENGGFPQFYPLRKGYYSRVTFNDNATIGALRLLRDVARRAEHYAFVDEDRRQKAARAVARAVPLLLETQLEIGGVKTVWAQQYDEKTLKPAPARAFEPVALSAGESVGIVRFLMLDAAPEPATVEAIEAAVRWFRANRLDGLRWERRDGGDYALVKDRAAPPIWARLYEIDSMRPIFIGRDAVVRYDVSEIDAERRSGYAWFVAEPNELIERDYPRWREKIKAKKDQTKDGK